MDKWLYRISVSLAVLGLLVAVYMTIYKITSNDSMCLGSGDCSTVNASRYSEVNGIPVAIIGVLGYLAILVVHYMERGRGFFKAERYIVDLRNGAYRFSFHGVAYLCGVCFAQGIMPILPDIPGCDDDNFHHLHHTPDKTAPTTGGINGPNQVSLC